MSIRRKFKANIVGSQGTRGNNVQILRINKHGELVREHARTKGQALGSSRNFTDEENALAREILQGGKIVDSEANASRSSGRWRATIQLRESENPESLGAPARDVYDSCLHAIAKNGGKGKLPKYADIKARAIGKIRLADSGDTTEIVSPSVSCVDGALVNSACFVSVWDLGEKERIALLCVDGVLSYTLNWIPSTSGTNELMPEYRKPKGKPSKHKASKEKVGEHFRFKKCRENGYSSHF